MEALFLAYGGWVLTTFAVILLVNSIRFELYPPRIEHGPTDRREHSDLWRDRRLHVLGVIGGLVLIPLSYPLFFSLCNWLLVRAPAPPHGIIGYSTALAVLLGAVVVLGLQSMVTNTKANLRLRSLKQEVPARTAPATAKNPPDAVDGSRAELDADAIAPVAGHEHSVGHVMLGSWVGRGIVLWLLCTTLYFALWAINGWRPNVSDWWLARPLGYAFLTIAVAPMVILCGIGIVSIAVQIRAGKRAQSEWFAESEARDPTLRPPVPRPALESFMFEVGGLALGAAAAWLLRPVMSTVLPAALVAFIFLMLPALGFLVGWFQSPQIRGQRDYERAVAASENRHRRQRVYDALVWWSSEGAQLNGSSEFRLAWVKRRGRFTPDLARYQDAADLCSSPLRAEQLAMWAADNLPDLVREHTEKHPMPAPTSQDERHASITGLKRVLLLHHKREITMYEEASAYHLNQAVEAHRDESPEHLVQRLLDQFNAVALSREKGLERVHEIAAGITDAAKRERYIRDAGAGVNAALEAFMQAEAAAV